MNNDTGRACLPRWRVFALHVFALSGLVFAQPLYSWISAQPEFLVAHGAGTAEVLWIVLWVSVLFPLLLVGLLLPARLLGKSVSGFFQVLMIALLIGLFGLHALALPGLWSVVVFAGFLLAGGVAYWRAPLMRKLLGLAAVLALVFPLAFVFTEPVRSMTFSAGHEKIALGEAKDQIQTANPPDKLVVLVMFDELSAPMLMDAEGRIDRERFPNFARLADTSSWYPQATAPYSGTTVSAASLATGEYPDDEAYREARWQQHPDNIFTWLAGVYGDEDVDGEEVSSNLCVQQVCEGRPGFLVLSDLVNDLFVLAGHAVLPQGLARQHLPAVDGQWHRFGEQPVPAAITRGVFVLGASLLDRDLLGRETRYTRSQTWSEFIGELGQFDRGFYYQHTLLPHKPFEYLMDGTAYTDTLADAGYYGTGADYGKPHVLLEYQRHMVQTRYSDRLLGELLDALEHREQWDDTLLIVLTDHGRSFRQDSHRRSLDEINIADVLNIPLFIKFPGQQAGRVDEYPASLVDILPTIADVLERELPYEVDGVSLVAEQRPARDQIRFSCMGRFRCFPAIQARADEDDMVSIGVEEFSRLRRETLAWKQTHTRYMPAYDMHVPNVPEAKLLTSPVTAYTLARSEQGRIRLFDADMLDNVDTDGGSVPALVGGYVEDVDLREDESLVVALNRQLAAVGIAGERGGRQVFGALLPPQLLVEGDNELRVFRVRRHNQEITGLIELEVLE